MSVSMQLLSFFHREAGSVPQSFSGKTGSGSVSGGRGSAGEVCGPDVQSESSPDGRAVAVDSGTW